VNDVAKGCLPPEEPNESRIIVKKSFNFNCLNDHSKNSVKVKAGVVCLCWTDGGKAGACTPDRPAELETGKRNGGQDKKNQ
jgi:hypothetical protein